VEPVKDESIIEAYNENKKDLRQLSLADGEYSGIEIPLTGANLKGANLFRTNLNGLTLNDARLAGAKAERALFIGTKLMGADLREADLREADLSRADLTKADLRGCWTRKANLTGARVKGMKIDRRGLRALGSDYGGLTPADLADLDVEDDQVKLATTFGGFWTGIHLISIAVFVLPYAVFGVGRYVAALLSPCSSGDDCLPLREALWNYVMTGGTGDRFDFLSLTIFFLLLAYNVCRLSLVYKISALELAERAAGIPRQFVLGGLWMVAYRGCQILIWVNLLLVVINAYTLLDTNVPLAN